MNPGVIFLAVGIGLALMWVAFLVSGSALFGGSIFKPLSVSMRTHPVGYIAVMLLVGGVAVDAMAEGMALLGWFARD